jgi:prophage regulatory protein
MRFSQSMFDHVWSLFNQRDYTTFDDDLPGFGIYRADDGKMVYVVEYVKAGKLVRKKIGKTRKISLKKARKAARKILRNVPASGRHEPARQRTKIPVVGSEPEKVSAQAGRTIFKGGKPTPRLLRYQDLAVTRGITYVRRHLYRLEASGKFPKRVKMGESHVAWVESEIDEYLEKIIAERV